MPITMSEHKKALRKPPLCELLPVRDYLDGVAVQMDGSFVAGYELDGLNSYYHDDESRNRSKHAFEALVRSLPERSTRMQVRFEITEGIGDVRNHYPRLSRTENPVLQDIDRIRMQRWDENEERGFYLRHILHAYFIWNPRTHHEMADRLEGKKRNWFSLSVDKCIQREHREHADLLAEFTSLMAGVEQTLAATGRDLRPVLSSSAQEAILKALSIDPLARFSSARDFGEVLAKALSAPAPGWKPVVSSPSSRRTGFETGIRTPVLQVAYVLFIELADYAALPMDRQVDAMRQLEQIVRASHPVQSAEVDKSLIFLPSGEGMGLIFLADPTAPIQCAFDVAAELRSRPDIKYRMGMHSAPVYLTTDNDARRNVAGGCVAMAKLIMGYGDTGHILLSSSLADILVQINSWAPHLADLGERSISQGVRVHLYSFYKGELGNARTPAVCAEAHGQGGLQPRPNPPTPSSNVSNSGRASDLPPDRLESGRFEEGAESVLAEAARLARKSGFREVTTSHLFAAMVSGANPHLRNALTRKGIPPEALQSFLAKLLAKAPGSNLSSTNSGTIRLKLSRNAESVLLRATQIAATANRDRVSELDLLRGFVGQPEGSVQGILRVLRVSVSDLDPDLLSTAASACTSSRPGVRIGPLGEGNCSPEAWAALLRVASGRDFLTTADLLTGPLAGPLERFGLQSTAASRTQSATLSAAQGEIRCSKNAAEILSRALAIAAPNTVEITTLLTAFIESGGGSSGRAIRARGVKLEWLTSELFVDHGRLDMARLAPSGRLVLEQAFELACRRNDKVLSRDHLLYALLSVEGGYLATCLSRGPGNAGNLACLLLASLAPAKQAKRRIGLGLPDMESEAIEILCQAERMARRSQQPIGDEHLVCAMVPVGVSASIRQLLENNGVILGRLVPPTVRRDAQGRVSVAFGVARCPARSHRP